MKKNVILLFLIGLLIFSSFLGIAVKADEQEEYVVASEIDNSNISDTSDGSEEQDSELYTAETEAIEVSEVAAQSITNTGWYQEGGVWFYRGADGNLCRGWQTIGGKKYYFDPTHAYMYSDGWQYIQEESKKYYFTANGDLHTGWLKDSEFGWYYIKEGLYHDGWIQIGTVWYYIDNGRMIHDQYTYCVDGKYYGFKSNGAMLTGWNKVVYTLSDGTTDTDWYYYNTSGAAPNGWLQINSVWYYFYNGWMADDGVRIAGATGASYSFNADGTMMTSKWYQDWWSNEWYYFDADGKGLNGWIEGAKGWYYCVNGRMLYDCWYQTGTNEYSQFDANGIWLGTATSPGE